MLDHKDIVGALLERPPTTERRRGERMRKLQSLRERRRAENRDRHSLSHPPHYEHDFLCECARPDCSARLPLEVERHRRRLNRYIVAVGHADSDTVVGVADRFFIIEVPGVAATSLPPSAHARDPRTRVSAA
jgi:hypothetical protein